MLKKNVGFFCLVFVTLLVLVGFVVKEEVTLRDGKIKENIFINDYNISNLKISEAESLIFNELERKLKSKELTIEIENNEYKFNYPEIDFKTNLKEIVRDAFNIGRSGNRQKNKMDISFLKNNKMIFDLQSHYYLKDTDNIIDNLYHENYKLAQDATVEFKPFEEDMFVFEQEINGREIDVNLLKKDINKALNETSMIVKAKFKETIPLINVKGLKEITSLRSSFSTNFGSSSLERKHNINLSSKAINGYVWQPNEELSFNKLTGLRTEESGYKKANIILQGEFVEAFGGGVCQTSTTLYNALLLSNLEIKEARQHSLMISYVEPSFDAMVNSSSSDLRCVNNTSYPLFIRSFIKNDNLFFEIYGEKLTSNTVIRRVTQTLKVLEPPPPEILIDITGELFAGEKKVIKPEKSGLICESYLEIYNNGILIEKKFLRKSNYPYQKGVVLEGII